MCINVQHVHPSAQPVSGPSDSELALVLGGGAARGIAHVGVWRAFQEHDLCPCAVIGASVGALIGAAIAGGYSWSDIVARAGDLPQRSIFALNRRVILDGLRGATVFRPEPLRRLISDLVPVDRFEELRIPLAISAVSLQTGEIAWFGAGGRNDVPVRDAVYASCALPVCFPPARIGGRLYFDGPMRDAESVVRAVTSGVRTVVAVDLSARRPSGARELSPRRTRMFAATTSRTRRDCGKAMAESADRLVYVYPDVSRISKFDVRWRDTLVALGYDAAREWLASVRNTAA